MSQELLPGWNCPKRGIGYRILDRDKNGASVDSPPVAACDAHGQYERICKLSQRYTWQVMNRKIARKEIFISGFEHDPLCRDRKPVRFMKENLLGNDELYDYLVSQCGDGVMASRCRK